MEPIKIGLRHGPEFKIQQEIIEYLKIRDWYVKSTHGNSLMQGFPDLWANHPRYGARFIEVKNPKAYSFTPAQLESFPRFCQGFGVWLLVAATDYEYNKLFRPPNWTEYLMLLNQRSCK